MDFYRYFQTALALVAILVLIGTEFVQSSPMTNQCWNYCSSGGVCLKSNNQPKCICLPGWTGIRCEIRQKLTLTTQMNTSQIDIINLRNNLCQLAPVGLCNYRGTCDVVDNEYICHCDYPYIGEDCKDVSECYDYCLNNGICKIDDNDSLPKCTCQPGWIGTRCQRRIITTTTTTTKEPTTNIPCNHLRPDYCNSGTCISDPGARCLCPSTYTGNRCEIPIQVTPFPIITSTTTSTTTRKYKNCLDKPCQNNGECFKNGNSYYCFCKGPYTGTNCEIFSG